MQLNLFFVHGDIVGHVAPPDSALSDPDVRDATFTLTAAAEALDKASHMHSGGSWPIHDPCHHHLWLQVLNAKGFVMWLDHIVTHHAHLDTLLMHFSIIPDPLTDRFLLLRTSAHRIGCPN